MPSEANSDAVKKEKFFFHMNVFDEDIEEEEEEIEEDLPPPPPTFSEEELEAARQEGYARGHAEATKEQQESRSKFVADTLNTIASQIQTLFDAEEKREKTFETEALTLSIAVLEQILPYYLHEHGFDDLKDHLKGIIADGHGHGEILVEVAPDMTDAITAFMGKLAEKHSDLRFKVKGHESLSECAVQLSWNDGGAFYDANAMAEQALAKMKEVLSDGVDEALPEGLAEDQPNGHDESDKIEIEDHDKDQSDE